MSGDEQNAREAGPEAPGSWTPLFPLDAVLFPGTLLPLHIFEPRYQAMIRACREERRPFCLVLAEEHGPARVGCEGWVEDVLATYPDGRSDIVVRGGTRLALLETRLHPDGYQEGRTEPVEDRSEAEDEASRARLLGLFAEYRRALSEAGEFPSGEGNLPSGAGEAGYTFSIAAGLGLEPLERQRLLEMRSEREREEELMRAVAGRTVVLRSLSRRRDVVRGNGRLKAEDA